MSSGFIVPPKASLTPHRFQDEDFKAVDAEHEAPSRGLPPEDRAGGDGTALVTCP